MASQLNPISPASGSSLPQRTIANGETLRIDQQNNVAVAATVLMPTVYDDNTIVIVRAAGDAEADPITIDGNGQTIDGETEVTLDWNRGVVVLGRDAELGEWCKLLAPRILDGSVGELMKARDVKGVVGGSPAGWLTAFDIDFTAQPSQLLTADGAHVIGGVTFTKRNSAADRVAMQIVNGTGLIIRPNGGANAILGGTSPWLGVLLSNIPGAELMGWQSPIRVWAYLVGFTTDSLSSDNKFGLGVGLGSTVWQKYGNLRWGAANATAQSGQSLAASMNENAGAIHDIATATNRALVATMPNLFGNPDCLHFSTGDYVGEGGWPAPNKLRPQVSQAQTGWAVGNDRLIGEARNAGAFITAAQVAGGNSVFTVGRLRVDFMI